MVAPLKVVTAPAPMLLVKLPLAVIVTLSVSVQLVETFNMPPLKEKILDPGVAVMVPPQVPTFRLAGFATIIPEGMVSVKLIPVNTTLLGLTNCTLKVEAEPPNTVRGLNPFTTPIEMVPMIRFALAGARELIGVPVDWMVAVTLVVGIVLVLVAAEPRP